MSTAQAVLSNDIKPQSNDEMVQFLTFTLGEEEYGVHIMMVREVKGWSETTRLPNTPDYIRGVLNLRGVIIPIFDLRARFGLGLTDAHEKNVIIILSMGTRTVGILADTVSDILNVKQVDIQNAPDTSSDINHRFVSGLIAREARMVVVLDVERILSNDLELIQTETAPSESTQH